MVHGTELSSVLKTAHSSRYGVFVEMGSFRFGDVGTITNRDGDTRYTYPSIL